MLLILLTACQSTTVVKSSDPDAYVVADNQRHKGDLVITDSKPFWGSTIVSVEKEGCKTFDYKLYRYDDVAPHMILFAPATYGLTLFWFTKYRPTHELAYKCEPKATR